MKRGIPGDYGERIYRIRTTLGLTQVQFAEALGVSFASVNRWENGKSQPSLLAWNKILRAEAGGVSALADEGAALRAIREPAASYEVKPAEIKIDFSAPPEVVRTVAEGERLAYGHLFNPAFAAEASLIDALPHQRIAVYERMLKQPRLRFLLADDAGAGKTIMAGLYIREMLARRLIRRVLIVPPAGLLGNWERELRRYFSLPFRIVTGNDARANNPFIGPDSDLLIASVDTLARERMFSRLQEWAVDPYDLVIFDEAHKLSADREADFHIRKTDRYLLAEALVGAANGEARWKLGWYCRHLLLLTATPHMGKDFPYYCLWRLLEPEALATFDAFHSYPADARQQHFIRRMKEEMVRFDGGAIYPTRISDTMSYDLSQGEAGEQRLYDETTAYIRTFYNRARILNRSAARFAMSIFQRRLASSTYALMRSFERRLARLDNLIDSIHSGRITVEQLLAMQNRLQSIHDVLDEKTADEESIEEGREENEAVEELALGGVVAVSLAELETERRQVKRLLDMARQVFEGPHEDSKFGKLREILLDPRFKDEKIIIFTEYRDTLDFLVRRLEGIGFAGQVAQVHGGMDWQEREAQVEFFKRPATEGGATYLVATDAAGEGINLQFCWLTVNYDIPWNPARLEQRMGRVHRYGQKHDPVIILNLIAGKTREGRVLRTLLDKLERIRVELGAGKVFDVIGRLFEGVSLKAYMEQALTEEGAAQAQSNLEGTLTKEQVLALQERERLLFGDGGDVRRELPRLHRNIEQETYRRLVPGYVRRFVERAAPLVDIDIAGDLDGVFSFRTREPGALDFLWPALEAYPPAQRNRLTVYEPTGSDEAIWVHPGEPLLDSFRAGVCSRLGDSALQGSVFIDPTADRPYFFHLARVTVERNADPDHPALARGETVEQRLVGLKHEGGQIVECPVEHLLFLRGGQGLPAEAVRFSLAAQDSREMAKAVILERVAGPLAEKRRQALLGSLPERSDLLRRGFDYQEAELAAARARFAEKTRAGDPHAKGEVTRIKERQRDLAARRDRALAALRREPELIAPGDLDFLAHALVVPSDDPEDRARYDKAVETIAVGIAQAYEEGQGATVKDVSTPELATAAGLQEHPGFDLLSRRRGGEELPIEVKGRAGIGDVELSENEWAKACNLRQRYWLYVAYNCASAQPQLLRVQDPFYKLVVRPKGGVVVDERSILDAAESQS